MPYKGNWFKLRDWDLFGYPISLHHKEYLTSYKTSCGGFMSLLLYVGVILFAYMRVEYI